jgi:alpha-1,3-rhamnosyl/mannosyltransferase
VRAVLRGAADDPRFALTLLAGRHAERRLLREEFASVAVVRNAVASRAGPFDAVWFPFNGMRYRVAAPAAVTMYDAFAFTEPARGRIARFREQTPMRRAARQASLVMTISAWSRAEIARELGLDSAAIEVVSPAPDPIFTPDPGDPPPAMLAGRRFALMVGAREPRKNARFALEACALTLRSPHELLVVAGELGRAEREFARDRGLRVRELAPSDPVLRSLYRNAAVVLVPSLAEGFGLVALEAMACGAPVLAAATAALPEATAGAATLLDPTDPSAWAGAIRALFDDAELGARARAAGLARVALFDRAEPVRRVLGLLAELARGGRSRPP